MQKHVNLVDLDKSFLTNMYCLLARIGVDAAENEPLKVHFIFKLWVLIFIEPPRPRHDARTLDASGVHLLSSKDLLTTDRKRATGFLKSCRRNS